MVKGPLFAVIIMLFLALPCLSYSEINILDYGAKGDGTTDNTVIFQAALDNAAITGTVVAVPAGQYRIDGFLTVPENTTLRGECSGLHFPEGTKGTVLMAYDGRDNEAGDPFITLKKNSSLIGVTVIYPEQKASDIRPYPWTVRVIDKGNIYDVSMANSYNGIDCGTYRNGGTHVNNVYMCALRRGLYIDRSGDIGRFENIHVFLWAWSNIGEPWTPDPEERRAYMRFVMDNLEGFIIGRTDWSYMNNCFVLRPNTGFHFIETVLRPEEDHTYPVNQANILIARSGSDLGKLAVKIDKVQDHAGIVFDTCQFMNGIEIGEENTGPVKLTNCGFWGETNTGPLKGSVIVNRGSGELMVTASHFSRWEDLRRNDVVWKPEMPLIEMKKGSLILNGCSFKDYDDPPDFHILLGQGVTDASLMGNNVSSGSLRVDNRSGADIQRFGKVTLKE